MTPWAEFAEAALRPVLEDSPLGRAVDPREVAHAVVAVDSGLELLTHLDGDRAPAMALFDSRLPGALIALMARTEAPSSDDSPPQKEGER